MSACVQSSHVCQADSYLLSIIAEVQQGGRDPETRLREKFVLTIAPPPPPVWCTESLYTAQAGYYTTTGRTGQQWSRTDFMFRSQRRTRMSSKTRMIKCSYIWSGSGTKHPHWRKKTKDSFIVFWQSMGTMPY